jgi:hypothetical protein
LGDGSVEDESPEESVDQTEEDRLYTVSIFILKNLKVIN